MKKLTALTISVGVLSAVAMYLTATILPVPIWVTFTAWASYFILGGNLSGFGRSLLANLSGVLFCLATFLATAAFSRGPIVFSLFIGVAAAAMVQASQIPLLSAAPALFWGFASTVSTIVAYGKPMTTIGWDNPALVAATAVVMGNIFGLLSTSFCDALSKEGDAAPQRSQG